MKIAITSAFSLLFCTLICVILVNIMSFNQQVAKANDYHYATVNEVESSDFAESVINEIHDKENTSHTDNGYKGYYSTEFENVSVKDDLQIWKVTTTATIRMPIFGFKETYVKESTAR